MPVLDPSPQGELDSGKWSGASKLVFSVDIGTMQSAVSFVYLENGKAPEIKHVMGWPGEHPARAKTLSAMYYDKIGNPCAYGINTQNASVKEKAKVEQWTLVHSFKRYIHRLGTSAEISDDADVQALPNNVSETKLYADWLKFLFNHAKQIVSRELAHFSDSTNTEVVFTVPNGWYTQEQAILSNAAVEARIVRKPSAVKFVPETEAAVHWALEQGDLKPKAGTDFIVCDSGGSTTDIAMYKVISVSPLKLCEKEGNPSRCIEAGSALIDEDFNDMIGDHLNNEGLRDVEILEAKQKIAGQFQLAKNQFDGSNLQSTYSIPLTGAVSGGGEKHIPVSRENMIKWFDDVIDTIIAGIDDVLRNNKPQFLLLRGDFGYSPYFQKRLRAHFKRMKLIPASEQNVKAAAAGALVWFQKRSVVSRAARFAYGVEVNVPYDPTDREHVYRAQGGRLTASGNLKHGWGVLVPYGKVLEDDEECTKDYELILPRADAPMVFEFTVYLTEGAEPKKWLCDRSGNVEDDFREVCTVKADLSGQRNNLRKYGSSGGQYYFPFEIALDFGSTSLEACVLWKEGDKMHRGQGEIIPSDFV
ncbi:hypothetical protein SCHPADRAFT_373073 [Schizopora paradoxa]|uniref:Actin-like ATPase domain-containing protein n=1 Tax=Schizopora paradoxa TaxID=27342 RepID=A0A0H2S8S1_9AGAM|nr:hypothetical protein SCHPADRAFT_373073 [Schizopora paradoxa]